MGNMMGVRMGNRLAQLQTATNNIKVIILEI